MMRFTPDLAGTLTIAFLFGIAATSFACDRRPDQPLPPQAASGTAYPVPVPPHATPPRPAPLSNEEAAGILALAGRDVAEPPATASTPRSPGAAVLRIDGAAVGFPPGVMTVKPAGDAVAVRLYSDDPPEAIRSDYAGDSFHFDWNLPKSAGDGTAGGLYDGVMWRSVDEAARYARRPPGRTGIFLQGGRIVLTPAHVVMSFVGDAAGAGVVSLDGLFDVWRSGRAEPYDGQTRVSGEIPVTPPTGREE